MGEGKLPGWLIILVGIVVMGYSKFIMSKQPAAKLGLFFWLGIIIVIFGILREVGPRLGTKRPKKEHAGPPHHAQHTIQPHIGVHQSPHMTHQHVQPQQHPSHPYQPLHKQCPRCHQVTHGQSRFCHQCGHRFF